MCALHPAERFSVVEAIEVGVVIDRAGAAKAGASTIADFERISESCAFTLVRQGGRYIWRSADQARGRIVRADGLELGGAGSVPPMCSVWAPRQEPDVSVLEASGESSSRAAGGAPSDEVNMIIRGRGADGDPISLRQSVVASREVTPFTVGAATMGIERLVGLGRPAPGPGLYLAEHVIAPPDFAAEVTALGVQFSDVLNPG